MPQKRLPVFKLVIDQDAEGMDFMGLVDAPAHGKTWVTLSKLPKKVELKQYFNEEKRIVSGVAIATDLQIYRRDESGFEYNIVFTKKDVLDILKMFSKKKMFNNVNFMHDMERIAEGIYLIEMSIIRDDKSNIPTEFKDQNLQAGSLIFSYWAESDTAWKFIKENGAGFSIEGWFKEVEVKFHKQKKAMKKSLLERLGFGKTEPTKHVYDKTKKDKYESAVTVDGINVTWEGELKKGTPLFVVPADGTDPLLASGDQEYAIVMEGVTYVCKVDEAGLITTITEGEEMKDEETEDKETEEALSALKADYEKKIADLKAEHESKFSAVAKEVDEVREAFEKFAEKKGTPRIPSGTKPTWRDQKKK